ncbi:MAG: hypothetical protein WDM87_10205 [Terracidiphilus sp.]
MRFLGLVATINWQTVDWHWVWLVVATFLAGVLNAVAGGGSFLSFPAMPEHEDPTRAGQATNTVAIWAGDS